jgi:CopG family nickel-responsive transcriptional regulator
VSDLVRFGVAMDRALLAAFDRRIAARGYENRSEALRDLVRDELGRASFQGGARVAATLTLVVEAGARDPLADLDEGEAGAVLASMRVPVAPGRTLEVMALSGPAPHLTALAGRLGGARGVLSAELTMAAGAADLTG